MVDSLGRLIYGHRLIIDAVVNHVRDCYRIEPNPSLTLPNPG
jgi:hypothetical protein